MKPFTRVQPDNPECAIYTNGKYQVVVRNYHRDWLELSIRREDRKHILDWRDIQWIKNQILGTEVEMVQLFPAESRLVDTANQYYFYAPILPMQFPLGFHERMVLERIRLTQQGHGTSVQRPFAEHVKPTDLDAMEREATEYLNSLGCRQIKETA